MGKCKRKMADGGMVAAGQKQWQERLAEMWATKPKPAAYADGGAVETPEQVMARMAKKYGTGVPEQKAETPPQRPPTGQPQQNPQQPTSRAASLVDSVNRRNDELKKAANYAVGGMVGEEPAIQQSQGMLGAADYSAGPKQSGFVWSDGTRRDGLTLEQAQKQDAQVIAAPVAVPQPAPLMTMAEKQVAQGINPNAAYRPGGPGDPHASGGMAATAAQTASLAAAQPALPVPPIAQPIVNPMDATQRRGQRRTAAYADGGRVIPVNIGQGLYQAIAQPIAEDWRQGNVAIKNLRDQYPTADAIAGINPAVAAAQVANDVMSGQVGGDTAMNVAQAVPMVKGLSGMAKMLSKQSGPTVGGVKFVVDMPTTLKKNAVITAGQTLGQPANAFADGGMVKFSGKGGPRDDQIPVKVAGAEIRVSDGEQAVILPAKTANNPGAVQEIGQIIQQSNDGRAPKMGMADGGRYARGANALTPAELAAQIYQEQTGQQAPTGANPAPATRGVTGVFQSGSTASFQAPQHGQVGAQAPVRTDPGKYPYTGQAAQSPYQDASLAGAVDAVTPTNHLASHPIYSGVSLGGMIDAVTSSGGAQQAAPSQQTKIVAQPAPGGGMAAVATQPKPQATQQAAHAKGVLDWLPEGGVLRPENRQEFGQKFAEISERGMAGRGILTGKPTAQSAAAQKQAPQQAQASYSNEGRQSAVQSANMDAQTADPSVAATTGNSGARVMPSGAVEVNMGRGFDQTKLAMASGSGMISDATGRTMVATNMDPNQYTAADGTKNARWEQTQAYIDAQNRLQADKLRVAEMQAVRQGMNPVQAAAATQGMAQAAQRAPLDRAVVQQQIETGKVAAQNSKELQDLYAAHKAAATPDEQERIAEQIRIRIGKDKPEEFAHAAGGTTINPSTMGVEKTPDVIYSKRTGKTPGASPVAAKTFSKSDVDAAISAGASKEAVAARIKSMGMNPKDYGL